MVSIGIDLSLCNTGLVILANGKVIKQVNIKSKPSGDLPKDELIRMNEIIAQVKKEIIYSRDTVDIVVIEGLAFMARNTTALVQLAFLSYSCRQFLYKMYEDGDIKNCFVIVAPTQLKKFATGKGNCGKEVIMKEIYKRYKVDFNDNNLSDGFILSKIGEALLKENKEKLTKPQEEVINMLEKQIN